MRFSRPGPLLIALVAVLLTGCQSLEKREPVIPDQPSFSLEPLSKDQKLFADALSYYSRGIIHEIHREYDEAMEYYLLAARNDPQNLKLHFQVARRLLKMKRTDEAVRLIEALVERNPESEETRIWQALVYQASNQPEKAKDVYLHLIEVGSQDHIPYIDLASIFLREGSPDEAEKILIKGTKKAERKLELYKILGQFYADALPQSKESPLDRERMEKAVKAYRKALETDPEEITVLYRLGDLYILDENLAGAIECFQRIEKLKPDDLQIKQRLALSFLEIGDIEKAIESLEAFVEKNPTNGAVYYYLGELHQQNGDEEKARLNFSLACKTIDDDPAPFLRLAILNVDGAATDAVRTLEEGLAKMPEDLRLMEMLAYAHLANEDTEAALTWFDKVDLLLPEGEQSASFHYNYALALYRAGRIEEAGIRLNRAMQENIDFLRRFVNQMLSSDDPDLEKPIGLLRQISMNFEDEPMVYMYLGMLNSFNDNFDRALAHFETTERLAEDDMRRDLLLDDKFYFAYGSAMERTGDYDHASELFLKAIELNPKNGNAQNYLAYMWAERGERLEEALEYIQSALELEPESPAFIDTLGWIYFMQGRYEDALREIERAVELLPDDATIIDHLGDVKLKLNLESEAVEHWKTSLGLDPSNEKVLEKLVERGVDVEPMLQATAAEKQEDPSRVLVDGQEDSGVAIDTGNAAELDGLEETAFRDPAQLLEADDLEEPILRIEQELPPVPDLPPEAEPEADTVPEAPLPAHPVEQAETAPDPTTGSDPEEPAAPLVPDPAGVDTP